MSRKKSRTGTRKRLSFPEDESNRPWLGLLLEAYFIVDRGVAKAIGEERRKGRALACSRGCANCCSTHTDIPVYPLEIAGISWYAAEKITGPDREVLKTQLRNFRKEHACPFLVDGVCAIHPVRPMACRQFNVFGQACGEGEDPYYSRREDVMEPVRKYVDQAFMVMLPFHGVENEAEKRRIVETGKFHDLVRELHSCRWSELAEKMERHDHRPQE